MKWIAAACEVTGLAFIGVGCWMLAPWLGVLVTGILLLVVGTAAAR